LQAVDISDRVKPPSADKGTYMKTRFFAATVISILLLNVVGASLDSRKGRLTDSQTMRLVSLLPASDIVAVFDSEEFFDEALPKLLAVSQPTLAEVVGKILEIKTITGIDFNNFENVAIGISSKQVSAIETDYEPVAIANVDINDGTLLAVAKLASKGACREEKIGDRTVYVFSSKEAKENTTNSKVAAFIAKSFRGLTKDVAVSALDSNTLVFGSFARVRETLEARSHVATDISSRISVEPKTVMTFAARNHGGMMKFPPLDTDEFGAIIDSIQLLAGSFQITSDGLRLQMSAKTKTREQMKAFRETFDGLRLGGKVVFGRSHRSDQPVYRRSLQAARIGPTGKQLSFDLLVPQVDIDILIRGMK